MTSVLNTFVMIFVSFCHTDVQVKYSQSSKDFQILTELFPTLIWNKVIKQFLKKNPLLHHMDPRVEIIVL